MNRIHLYRNSLAEARRQNELALWRASYRANIACKEAIEQAIRTGFDGVHLESGCLRPVLEEWGFKRTAWVLANTILEKDWDGRFSPANRQWANRIFVPADYICIRRSLFNVVVSHIGVNISFPFGNFIVRQNACTVIFVVVCEFVHCFLDFVCRFKVSKSFYEIVSVVSVVVLKNQGFLEISESGGVFLIFKQCLTAPEKNFRRQNRCYAVRGNNNNNP